MSIIINCMEMPTSCPCELLGIGYDLYCSFAGGIPARVKEYYECCQNGTRPSWCPLVPVPPHGRLIDADAIDDAFTDLRWENGDYKSGALLHWGDRPHWCLTGSEIENLINAAPTIIPASEEEM